MGCGCFLTAEQAQVEYAPWGRHDWMARPGLTDGRQFLFVRVRMPAGRAHQFHRHPGREELLYVLEGSAEQWVGGEKRVLRAGEGAFIPAGEVHGTYNDSGRDVRFLAILSPAELDQPLVVDVFDEPPWNGRKAPFDYGPSLTAADFA